MLSRATAVPSEAPAAAVGELLNCALVALQRLQIGGLMAGRFHYKVVKHQGGWAYRLDASYSRLFPTQWEATAAAKTEAREMHEPGDNTQVHVQDGPCA